MRKTLMGVVTIASCLIMGCVFASEGSNFQLSARAVPVQGQQIDAHISVVQIESGQIVCSPVMRLLRGELAECNFTGGDGPSICCRASPYAERNECVCSVEMWDAENTLYSESITVPIG